MSTLASTATWFLNHLPSLVAAIGALYAGRKVYRIEINTNSRLADLVDANNKLREANSAVLVQLERQSGRIEGTESPITIKGATQK